MQQGSQIYGYAAMLDGLIDRLESELRMPATTVITGGLASLAVPLLPKTDHRQSEPAVGRSCASCTRKTAPADKYAVPKNPLVFF